MSSQASVHVPAPAGEVWKRTRSMPRSELAVPDSETTPRCGVPGSSIETATVLKSAAAAKALPGEFDAGTKSAPEAVIPVAAATTAAIASQVETQALHAAASALRRAASAPRRRHRPARLRAASRSAGSVTTAVRTSRRPRAASAWPA